MNHSKTIRNNKNYASLVLKPYCLTSFIVYLMKLNSIMLMIMLN